MRRVSSTLRAVTVYTSQMISGMIGQQVGMFQGYGGYAQGIGVGAGLYPPQYQQQPMMMPPPQSFMGTRPGQAGMYGEQVAMRMASMGRTAMGVGGVAAGFGASMLGIPTDPMGGALMGALGGFGGGLGGMATGALAGTGIGLGIYGATQAVRAYGNAFFGGMQDQSALNSTLRNNFSFFGGQGANGRGFGQAQMGQIGQMISGELRRNPFTSGQELNNLIAGGAESGMFTGTRDVQAFTQNFRRMLDTLRGVQRELGGTLTEALQFVRSSQQAGIFQNADRVNFASEIRSAEAVTGMDRNQLIALSAQGANIARTYGARGQQGAFGVLRAAQTMGSALSSGAVSQELLSEATGGLTGSEAVAAFATRTMERSGAFSRTAMGRFSLFALSNASGTGLDEDMLSRFQSGDLSVGDVSRRAHRTVGRMGRARALNREGRLRGELMEEGGLSAQIGMMRLMVGERVMDAGDDLGQLVLQRRFHMSQPESEMMMRLMRNQGRIAETEAMDRMGAARSTARATDIAENRSFDAFARQIEHGLSDATGLTAAREMGRRFQTRISGFIERAMNDMMGVTEQRMTAGDTAAMNRMFVGRATRADRERLDLRAAAAGGLDMRGSLTEESLFGRSLAGEALHALGLHAPETVGETLIRRGVRGLRGPEAGDAARRAIDEMRDAREGLVRGDSRRALERLTVDEDRTTRRMTQARLMAAGMGGDTSSMYSLMGGDANAIDAYRSLHGMAAIGTDVTASRMANLGGGGRITAGMVGRDLLRVGALGLGAVAGGPLGIGVAAAGIAATGGFETWGAMRTPEETAASALGGRLSAFATRMERRAGGRTGADVRETLDYIDEAYAGDEEGREAARRRTLAMGENRAALMAEGARGITEETLATLSGSEAFQARTRRILAAEGGDITEEINQLRREAEAAGGDQATAMAGVAEMLEEDMTSHGGHLSEATRAALSSSGLDQGRITEIIDRRHDMARFFERTGERVADRIAGLSDEGYLAGGGAMTGVSTRMRELAASFRDVSTDPTEAARAMRLELAQMDPNSEAYRAISESMGTGEEARAYRASVAETRGFLRDVTGAGRRGRRGADEAALGRLTGGTLSDMSFNITRGGRERTVRGASSIMSLLRGGGADADTIAAQLTEQLGDLGVTGASDLVSSFRGAAAGGFTTEEAADLERRLEESGVGEAVERRRAEETEANQRRSDPLGVQRNDLLTQIRDAIRANAPPDGGGEPRGDAEHG